MYYFIVNPYSRSGYGYIIWKKVERRLNQEAVQYQAFLTERQGQASEYARQLTAGCREPRIIVVVGGDGTMNEVLDGLDFGSAVTIGYISVGTGSDLARGLRLPRSPIKELKKILHPKYYKQIDYGVLTYGDDVLCHRRFAVSAGIGLDAAVCHTLQHSRLKEFFNRIHMRRMSYVAAGVMQYFKAKPVKGYILLDGNKRVEFNHIYFITAQLQPCEGGGFWFAPKADCSDGLMEVCVVSNSSKRELFPILLRALMRRSHNKGMRTYSCSEVKIHTERPMAVHVDGENCRYQCDIEMRCIERKLRMIV